MKYHQNIMLNVEFMIMLIKVYIHKSRCPSRELSFLNKPSRHLGKSRRFLTVKDFIFFSRSVVIYFFQTHYCNDVVNTNAGNDPDDNFKKAKRQ